jgi:heat shock protein HslJ
MESSMKVVVVKGALAAAAALCAGCTAINLGPDTLQGMTWRIATLNGTPMPAVGDYTMRFNPGGNFGARFGCNHMGGRYRIAGSTLTVSDVTTTLIGCPEPERTFEAQGSAILQQPMQVSFTSNERMSLSNAAGT